MFIALEGADGCGKSTLCEVLANALSAVACSTPPEAYRGRREDMDKNATAEDHYKFYRDGVLDSSREIEPMLSAGKIVVVDRYWLTTYTYHQLRGVQVSVDDFEGIVKPDLTVLLALNHATQLDRMGVRGMTTDDRVMLAKQKELTAAFYRNVLEFKLPFLVVDTEHFDVATCARIVARAVECLS